MSSYNCYYCPRCFTTLVFVYSDYVKCPFCGLSFKKDVCEYSNTKIEVKMMIATPVIPKKKLEIHELLNE